MSLEEMLELKNLIIMSNMSDEQIGRFNELFNKALDYAKMQERERIYAEMKAIYDDGK